MVSYKSISKEASNKPTSYGKKMLDIKSKNRIRNTIIRQGTRVTDIVDHVTNAKWK